MRKKELPCNAKEPPKACRQRRGKPSMKLMSIVGYDCIRRPAIWRELWAAFRVAPGGRPCTGRTRRRCRAARAVEASPSLLRLDAELEGHRDGALPVHGFASEFSAAADVREGRLDGVAMADRHPMLGGGAEEGARSACIPTVGREMHIPESVIEGEADPRKGDMVGATAPRRPVGSVTFLFNQALRIEAPGRPSASIRAARVRARRRSHRAPPSRPPARIPSARRFCRRTAHAGCAR